LDPCNPSIEWKDLHRPLGRIAAIRMSAHQVSNLRCTIHLITFLSVGLYIGQFCEIMVRRPRARAAWTRDSKCHSIEPAPKRLQAFGAPSMLTRNYFRQFSCPLACRTLAGTPPPARGGAAPVLRPGPNCDACWRSDDLNTCTTEYTVTA
jgi:hypothetical protein